MITPSKTISFKDSIAFKMMFILDERFEEISLVELYKNTKRMFLGLDEFIYALDALYVLGKIDMDFEQVKVKKC
jgi:hypothetical protein